MVIHAERRDPRHAHNRCKVRQFRNRRTHEYDHAKRQTCDCRKQRDPASKHTRQKQQQNCAGKGEVNRPGDHARLRIR
jgi:hypothetical protein